MVQQQSQKFQEAFAKHKAGNLTIARDMYLEIVNNEPNNAEVWDLLGVLYCQVNDFEQSEICIKKAIAINPRFYYLENLAKLYLEKGDFQSAISLYEDIIPHNKTYENFFNMAMAYKTH